MITATDTARVAGDGAPDERATVCSPTASTPVPQCALSASRGGKPIQLPVANVSHVRSDKMTELLARPRNPRASIDYWA